MQKFAKKQNSHFFFFNFCYQVQIKKCLMSRFREKLKNIDLLHLKNNKDFPHKPKHSLLLTFKCL